MTLTQEGEAFLEDCQRILTDLANAEAQLTLGSTRATGHLKVTAPANLTPGNRVRIETRTPTLEWNNSVGRIACNNP